MPILIGSMLCVTGDTAYSTGTKMHIILVFYTYSKKCTQTISERAYLEI